MFPEEKFGSLEMPGEISPMEEEDVTDPPTIVMPERQYRKEEKEEESILWPFF
jgi:hypothetical protein